MQTATAVSDKISALVEHIVQRQLAPARLQGVRVTATTTWDDEEIVQVDVVVAPGQDRLDPASVAGLARHLREPLAEAGEERTVVFRFLTPEDMRREAA